MGGGGGSGYDGGRDSHAAGPKASAQQRGGGCAHHGESSGGGESIVAGEEWRWVQSKQPWDVGGVYSASGRGGDVGCGFGLWFWCWVGTRFSQSIERVFFRRYQKQERKPQRETEVQSFRRMIDPPCKLAESDWPDTSSSSPRAGTGQSSDQGRRNWGLELQTLAVTPRT